MNCNPSHAESQGHKCWVGKCLGKLHTREKMAMEEKGKEKIMCWKNNGYEIKWEEERGGSIWSRKNWDVRVLILIYKELIKVNAWITLKILGTAYD